VQAGRFRLDDLSFEVPSGGYGVLMGKTGSGKTTVLEAIAGLKAISAGRIVLGELDVTRLKPGERNIGFVPQDGALFSTMPVRDQLGFALAIRRVGREAIEARVRELAELLEITHLLGRGTTGLSGGEQQRVALGRALAFQPTTLCLDEPLSALDDDTRGQTMELLKRVQHETGVTVLHITHNRGEADALADVLLEIADGRVSRRATQSVA
jgi:ABC-type sugar transport system ATPase subunit